MKVKIHYSHKEMGWGRHRMIWRVRKIWKICRWLGLIDKACSSYDDGVEEDVASKNIYPTLFSNNWKHFFFFACLTLVFLRHIFMVMMSVFCFYKNNNILNWALMKWWAFFLILNSCCKNIFNVMEHKMAALSSFLNSLWAGYWHQLGHVNAPHAPCMMSISVRYCNIAPAKVKSRLQRSRRRTLCKYFILIFNSTHLSFVLSDCHRCLIVKTFNMFARVWNVTNSIYNQYIFSHISRHFFFFRCSPH